MEIIIHQNERWNKKRLILVAAILSVLLVGLLYALTYTSPREYSTLAPNNIIKDNPNKEEGTYFLDQIRFDSNTEIDVRGDIQYNTEEYAHVFDHSGMYQGKYFRNVYRDDDSVKMMISQNITPDNGVIESYLLVKIDYPDVIANVIVDNDWRKLLGEKAYIMYGPDFLNETTFVWNEIAPGIYATTIIQHDADKYKRTAPVSPSINIAVSDKTRTQIFTGATNVTMAVYK